MARHLLLLLLITAGLTAGEVRAQDAAGVQTQTITSIKTQTSTVTGASTTLPALEVAPVVQEFVPATNRASAVEQARTGAGRADPFSPIDGLRPFPTRHGEVHAVEAKETKRVKVPPFVPPPPPNTTAISPGDGHHAGMVEPPPMQEGLAANELPAPPEKPSLVDKLKLVGIIGNRALFTFTDPALRAENKWPRCISLGTGEQFESISVLSISPDTVTLEEDGERQTKELSRIR